jgi:hypothetical protein
MGLEFETAAKRRLAEGEQAEPAERGPATIFKIAEYVDGEDEPQEIVECEAYYPGENAIVVFMADVMSRRNSTAEKAVGLIDFFFSTLSNESNDYLYRRLVDPEDPFNAVDIREITMALIEEWGGRPTKQPSDFAPSRKTGGRSSTQRTSRSTSSRSRSTGSSTRSTRSA